ncbi:protein C18orf25 homolog isoform X3 [Ictalurus punctatus]|uniref:Protein C18orf25 homolog isoform X3 n=1 Tax=Ictalurus punctatus TaxID=7998 RepID=A0A2D0SZ29_ICTPU|nr:protein C18orf25 homolog isoform X3 [Ictalurus punctatus]XP_053504807.1 protein C18orf25 homolog isoform X3 [Ictalurus furcatus]
MAEGQKATELSDYPTLCGATADNQDLSLKPEALSSSSPTCEESVSMPLPPGLMSMPCLLKELRRDSSPEAVPPEKDPASSAIQICPQEDSDSSACLRSPSSSGHLGDSDTLSSAEEEDLELADAQPVPSSRSDPAPRKSSRRSRSESDASAGVSMAAKKNRCQEKQANGGRTRERGKRSQRHKERIRLLRQKREAVAKRKSRPLEDSSTSDSDATAHSTSSSTASSDNEGGTGSLHPPGLVEVAPPQVSLPLSDSEVEIVGVQENTSAVSRFPRGGVIQSLSAWKQTAMPHWTAVSAQPDWAPPPEVVDLTLDEDRHRYLL